MKKVLALLLVVSLAGCVKVQKTLLPDRPPGMPISFKAETTSALTFQKAITTIKRGTKIFQLNGQLSFETNMENCNGDIERPVAIEWDGEKKILGDWDSEVGVLFYNKMKGMGFRVAGNPSAIFNSEEKRMEADFLVGATVTKLMGNFCKESKRDEYAGEVYTEVTWTLYDPALKKIAGEFNTNGYGRLVKKSPNGFQTSFLNAFEDATEQLALDPKFVELLSSSSKIKNRDTAIAELEKMSINVPPEGKTDVKEKYTDLIRGTVLVKTAEGHGSGFVISSDGYILTAEHVVGEAEKTNVRFDNGLQLGARVLRRSAYRDVALLKVEIDGLTPLPIKRNGTLVPMEEVYAIGAPRIEALQSSITRGMVSAIREKDQSGLLFIQSDVTVAGGNSGGPLVDKFGNVVGITVQLMGVQKFSSGLNFFVPIDDALKYLNLEVSSPKAAN